MSMQACSYCGEFADTDNGEGAWDVPRLNSAKRYDFICGCCEEHYLTEDGKFDDELGQP